MVSLSSAVFLVFALAPVGRRAGLGLGFGRGGVMVDGAWCCFFRTFFLGVALGDCFNFPAYFSLGARWGRGEGVMMMMILRAGVDMEIRVGI